MWSRNSAYHFISLNTEYKMVSCWSTSLSSKEQTSLCNSASGNPVWCALFRAMLLESNVDSQFPILHSEFTAVTIHHVEAICGPNYTSLSEALDVHLPITKLLRYQLLNKYHSVYTFSLVFWDYDRGCPQLTQQLCPSFQLLMHNMWNSCVGTVVHSFAAKHMDQKDKVFSSQVINMMNILNTWW